VKKTERSIHLLIERDQPLPNQKQKDGVGGAGGILLSRTNPGSPNFSWKKKGS